MAMSSNVQYDLWNSMKFSLFTGCWEYTGALDKNGYGRFSWNHGYLRAHRAAWLFTFGEIPGGLDVCHSCDNPKCCNPNHLWLGTNADNQADCTYKGRGRVGTRNGRAVLTEKDIPQIRSMISNGKSLSSIGRDFGVAPHVIWRIKAGETWGHVV